MNRLPLVSFCALAAATVAAFFITQHLKVSTPLINGYPRPVPAVINPLSSRICGSGPADQMRISFYLQHRSDDVDVWMIDSDGAIVATLASSRYMRGGTHPVRAFFTWSGREDDGRLAPDGLYYVKVALLQEGRTVVISDQTGPLAVRVKSHPPKPRVVSVQPHLTAAPAPVRIHYTGNEHRGGTVRIYRTDLPGPPRLVKSFLTPWKGQTAVWDGRIDGRPAPAGVYLIGLDVTDAACSTGHFPASLPPAPGSTPGAGVTIRYLAAHPPISPVAAGRRTTVLVDRRGHAYTWSLRRAGGRRPSAEGSSRSYALSVPVSGPQAGLYELTLRWSSHATTVPIVAASERPAKILIVLPSLTWVGLDPGDEDGDGVPDTLSDGSLVQLARPLADGLPAGFGDEAGLIAYLDSVHQIYDLTTDYGLIAGAGGSLAGHRVVILAGTEEWVTPALGASLRSYVESGGHLVSLGIGSLLRGVTVSGNRAADPTAPASTDALGARPGPVASTGAQLIGVLEDRLGIFTGTAGLFRGFSSYQPFSSVAPPATILSAAGVSATAPSIIGYRLGRGLVEDIGLPGLGSMLARDVDAQQIVSRAIAVVGNG